MEKSLDELLNGEEAEIEAVQDVVEEPVEDTGPARDESGRFASKQGVEPEATPEVPPTEAEQTGLPKEVYEPLRRVRDENKTLKSQLDELTKQIQGLQQPPQPETPPPSLWEDEQGWQQHFGGQIAQQAAINARLDMSEMLASQNHDDFDEMKERFIAMMSQNPTLQQQALSAKHPWEKAYQIAKNAASAEQLGATNVDELKAKIREELMAEMQATTPAARPGLPPTLAGERNVGQRSGPAWSGPAPLEDLLR